MNWRLPLAASLLVLATPVLGVLKGFVAGVYAYLALGAFRRRWNSRPR